MAWRCAMSRRCSDVQLARIGALAGAPFSIGAATLDSDASHGWHPQQGAGARACQLTPSLQGKQQKGMGGAITFPAHCQSDTLTGRELAEIECDGRCCAHTKMPLV